MENKFNEKEKIIKHIIINNKNNIPIKKKLNLISLDKFHYNQKSKKLLINESNKNDEILNLKNNEKEPIKEKNKYELRKVRLKLPEEIIQKSKMIDYNILNKKNYNNINTQNVQSSIKNLFMENYENKKKLEDLINNFSLKKNKKNNFVQGNINTNQKINESKNDNLNINNDEILNDKIEQNIIKKEINKKIKENNDRNLALTLNNNNSHKKAPFYALDCKIYYKNKNVEKNTPFKKNQIKNISSFSKKLIMPNNSYLDTEKLLGNIKKRNNFKANPINLTNNDVYKIRNEVNNHNSLNSLNYNNLYSSTGRNKKMNNIRKNLIDEEIRISTLRNEKENNNIEKLNIKDNEPNMGEAEKPIYRKINILNNATNENINTNSENDMLTKVRKHHSFNRRSFKFLVHQTNKSRELSLSFNRRYNSKKRVINNNEILVNDSLSYSNIYNNETETHLDQESNKTTSIINFNNINDKRYHFGKEKKNLNYDSSSFMRKSIGDLIRNKKKLFDKSNYTENKNYYKKIINDNYIEYTPSSLLNNNEDYLNNKSGNKMNNKFNIFNKKSSTTMPKKKNKQLLNTPQNELYYKVDSSLSSLDINNNFNSVNNLDKDNKASTPILLSYTNVNVFSFSNLELLYFLEEKIKIIIDKIKADEKCSKECQQYINYYFEKKFYIEELRVFKLNKNRDYMINYIKMELLCYYLLYNISLGEKFSETKILLKSIIDMLYNNFLLFISFIISQNENRDNNIIIVLNKIVKDNLNNSYLKEEYKNLDENKYIDDILSNSKCINDYYKMIINNIYSNHIKESNNIKFPEAINNNSKELDKIKLELIIESFFIQSYSSLTKFSFDILKKFYYSFLCFNEFSDKNNNKLENEKENNIKRDKENKYLLPEIKDKEYSLILDLDETLIYAQRNFNYKIRKSNSINKKRIILRPGLYDFLHDMKSLFEIILFSSGTPDYVDPIIKTIEKKEKYFDHILYRHHITLDENGNNVKNLDLIGRDLKKVIIIDDIPRYFHLQKENGISIKPFFGNILSDAKTLKILSNVLKKIRNDVEETKDIRISLVKYNHLLYPEVINNIEE